MSDDMTPTDVDEAIAEAVKDRDGKIERLRAALEWVREHTAGENDDPQCWEEIYWHCDRTLHSLDEP